MKSINTSIGIMLFSALSVAFALWLFKAIIYPRLMNQPTFGVYVYLLLAASWCFLGLGLLKRLEWSRKGLITLAAVFIVASLAYPSHIKQAIEYRMLDSLVRFALGLLFFIGLIVFLSLPKTKLQFKNKKNDV